MGQHAFAPAKVCKSGGNRLEFRLPWAATLFQTAIDALQLSGLTVSPRRRGAGIVWVRGFQNF